MLIDAVHYGRKKIYRIYQGGEVVWYVGTILSLHNDLLVGVRSADDARLTAVLSALGNADNDHSIGLYGFSHGTSVGIVPFHHEQAHPVYSFQDADLDIVRARLGNHEMDITAYVDSELSGRAFNAKLGNYFADHRIIVERLGTAVAADGKLGNHVAAHLVEVRRLGTGTAADAKVFDHINGIQINAFYQVTGTAADAVPLGRICNIQVLGDYQATGTVADAKMGHLDSKLQIEAFYQSTGLGASAVSVSHDRSVRIVADYQSTGIGASAKPLNHNKDLAVEAAYQNSGVPASAISMGKIIGLRIDTTHEESATAAKSAFGNGVNSYTVNLENKLNGSAFPLVPFFHEKGVRFNNAVEGSIMSANLALLSGEMAERFTISTEHHGVVASCWNGNSIRALDILVSAEGAVDGVQIVSLAADNAVSCVTRTEAHLSDSSSEPVGWLDPIQTEDGLYIRQVYEATQNDSDLSLGGYHWDAPIQTEDGLYIRQVYKATQNGSNLILHDVAWLAPIQSDDGLYIRQASTIQIGTDIAVS